MSDYPIRLQSLLPTKKRGPQPRNELSSLRLRVVCGPIYRENGSLLIPTGIWGVLDSGQDSGQNEHEPSGVLKGLCPSEQTAEALARSLAECS